MNVGIVMTVLVMYLERMVLALFNSGIQQLPFGFESLLLSL